MRKIIVYNIISLDGYHTGPDNNVSVMFPVMGGVFDTYNAELLRTADVHLVGRVSFELFQSFWPKVAENPISDEWTPSQRELSQAGKSVKPIVVSDTLTGNWPDIHIIRRADAYQQIAELKSQPGKDILITSSRASFLFPLLDSSRRFALCAKYQSLPFIFFPRKGKSGFTSVSVPSSSHSVDCR